MPNRNTEWDSSADDNDYHHVQEHTPKNENSEYFLPTCNNFIYNHPSKRYDHEEFQQSDSAIGSPDNGYSFELQQAGTHQGTHYFGTEQPQLASEPSGH